MSAETTADGVLTRRIFPGLGVVGDSLEEAEQLIREGITIHIEGLREFGYAVPEPKTLSARIAVAA